MLHLPGDRLAELADAAPTAEEAEHLAACEECTRERAAQAALVRLALDERARLAPPLTEWSAIAARLRAEKVIVTPSEHRGIARRWMGRAAAAMLLVAGGVVAGRVSADAPVLPWTAFGGGADTAAVGVAAYASVEEAEAALRAAELTYLNATQYLVEMNAAALPSRDEALRGRLVVLDEVASTTARALNAAPYDPVLNSYYLSTLGAREATLRQLDASLPDGVRLTSY